MPEGPEVRKFADELASALKNKYIITISARTKKSREWLDKHPKLLHGRKLLDIFAYGKNLIGIIEGPYFFYSHQMMWGRWEIVIGAAPTVIDRRERARIVVESAAAILMSAPVFEIGEGNPFEKISYLHELGPNALLYPGEKFKTEEFVKRLTSNANLDRTIGSVLLDQTVVAGLGNYLRAEILFEAKLDPWRTIKTLTKEEIVSVSHLVPLITERAYKNEATVTDAERERMRHDNTLVYVPGKDYGTRHYVFRRTNLPCLICGTPIKQMRQETGQLKTDVSRKTENGQPDEEEDEKTRIIYFCQKCQQVRFPVKTSQVKKVREKILEPAKNGHKPAAAAPMRFLSLSNTAKETSPKQPVVPKEKAQQNQNKRVKNADKNIQTAAKPANENQVVSNLKNKPSPSSNELLHNTSKGLIKPRGSGRPKQKNAKAD
jgi:endonuclease VIII